MNNFTFNPTIHDNQDLVLALEAAKLGGDILLKHFKQPHKIESKSHGDFVTEADQASDKAICKFLKEKTPEYEIISEESATITNATSNNSLKQAATENPGTPTWIVDPLDSTKGFIKGLGPKVWSVMIALREDSKTTLGVIYFPIADEFYYAIKDKGAFINGKQIHVNQNSDKQTSDWWIDMNAYADSNFESTEFSKLRNKLRSPSGVGTVTTDIPASGIIYKIIGFGLPEEQSLDAVIHDNNPVKPKQEPWDIAPAQLILEEAGGIFVNTKGERINPFKPELIIAAKNQQTADYIRLLAS